MYKKAAHLSVGALIDFHHSYKVKLFRTRDANAKKALHAA